MPNYIFILCLIAFILQINSLLYCDYDKIYEECQNNVNFHGDIHNSVLNSNELCGSEKAKYTLYVRLLLLL